MIFTSYAAYHKFFILSTPTRIKYQIKESVNKKLTTLNLQFCNNKGNYFSYFNCF